MTPNGLEERLKRLEYAVFGLAGDNGLRSEVRGLRRDLQKWRDAEEKKDEETARERFRNRLTIFGLVLIATGTVVTTVVTLVQAF